MYDIAKDPDVIFTINQVELKSICCVRNKVERLIAIKDQIPTLKNIIVMDTCHPEIFKKAK